MYDMPDVNNDVVVLLFNRPYEGKNSQRTLTGIKDKSLYKLLKCFGWSLKT